MNRFILPTIVLGSLATIPLVQLVAISLDPTEINQQAKQFIVKINGSDAAPKGNGSGSIIGRNSNTYQVLTNWHVVSESDNFNDYTIQTIDETTHAVTQIKRLNGADLAIISFSSRNGYSVAKLGDSRNLTEGQKIHFAGYPAQQPRSYLFYPEQNINGFIPAASAEDGYEIIFTGAIVPGMSGSPLLNENGEIIGVYGRGGYGGPLYGIRVNTAKKLAQQQGINIASVTSTVQPSPSPQTQKTPTPTPQPSPTRQPPPTPQPSPAITTGRSGEQIIALSNPNYARDGIIPGRSGSQAILTPDQKQLITYGRGGNIKVWNLASGQLLRTLDGHSDYVSSVAISADGQTIVSGSGDTDIRVWRLN